MILSVALAMDLHQNIGNNIFHTGVFAYLHRRRQQSSTNCFSVYANECINPLWAYIYVLPTFCANLLCDVSRIPFDPMTSNYGDSAFHIMSSIESALSGRSSIGVGSGRQVQSVTEVLSKENRKRVSPLRKLDRTVYINVSKLGFNTRIS